MYDGLCLYRYINTSAFSVACGDLDIYILSISMKPFYLHSFLYRCPITDHSSKMMIDNSTTLSMKEKYLPKSGSKTHPFICIYYVWWLGPKSFNNFLHLCRYINKPISSQYKSIHIQYIYKPLTYTRHFYIYKYIYIPNPANDLNYCPINIFQIIISSMQPYIATICSAFTVAHGDLNSIRIQYGTLFYTRLFCIDALSMMIPRKCR
jgi:hypothetical protein